MRKRVMSYANNKGADQPAHPCSLISTFVVRCLDSVMSLVSVTRISSPMLASVAKQASLSLTLSEPPEDRFSHDEAQLLLTGTNNLLRWGFSCGPTTLLSWTIASSPPSNATGSLCDRAARTPIINFGKRGMALASAWGVSSSSLKPFLATKAYGWTVSFRPWNTRTTKISRSTTKWHVHPVKTQVSLGIHPVWLESLLSAWRNLGSLTTHWVNSEDADLTGWMPRLIWVFAGRTCHFVGFVVLPLKSKKSDQDPTNCRNYHKILRVCLNHTLMHPNDAYKMANSADPSKTDLEEAVYTAQTEY